MKARTNASGAILCPWPSFLSSLGLALQAHAPCPAQRFFGYWQGSGPSTIRASGPYVGRRYDGPYPIGPGYTPYVLPYAFPPTYTLYVAPYPAYGILPPPFATMRIYDSWTICRRPAAQDGGGLRLPDRDSQPRKRVVRSTRRFRLTRSLPEDRAADLRRVRFEIDLPYEDAIVFINGVKTKQTGLHRVFVTPPMQEDRQYTTTIKVQWAKQGGGMTDPVEQTFTVLAGETVRHQFKDQAKGLQLK